MQRVVHWSVAISFVALALTGLILTFGKAVLLPLIGYTLFSWLATLSKNLHNFVGPMLVVTLPVLIVLFVRDNVFNGRDAQWIEEVRRHAVRRARPVPTSSTPARSSCSGSWSCLLGWRWSSPA